MPKMKTHRGAAKRFRKTGRGKVAARHAYRSHLLEKKPSRRKRRLAEGVILQPGDARAVRRLLPYL
ncbi:MAG: 50S ribosomal protein L35 [Firmicutes bacterium]|nr:50S ribosomal protein L35 [Bacillota bacterium]